MSNENTAATPIGKAKDASKPNPLQVRIVGKITRVRRYEQHVYTTVICPAKDAFSRPSVVEVRSKSRWAENEEMIDVVGELGGYEGKSYQVTDRETGERKTLVPVNLFLDLVAE